LELEHTAFSETWRATRLELPRRRERTRHDVPGWFPAEAQVTT
jgi:hypothetical protein